jgi:hypothetical protein
MAVTVTVPPTTTKLIALADLKAILGVTDGANDTLLGNIIQRGSDAMARFCNRVFAQRTTVETLPGPGGQLLKLKFSPVVTLTSIAFDGETVDSDTYTLTEPDAGIVFCESYWAYTGHKSSYTATCAHGYNLPDMSGADTLPHDIQQAALVVRPFVFDRFQNRVQSCEFHTSVSGGELPVHLHLRRVTGALPGSDFA